jgi:hypothetical protein
MNSDRPRLTPVSLAVVLSLFVSALILSVAAAIGGSYALTLNAIHDASVAAAQLHAREATAQIRAAVPTCRSIAEMDSAANVPAKDFPKPPANVYDERLSSAIHKIDTTTRCPLILNDLKKHMTFLEIAKQLGEA